MTGFVKHNEEELITFSANVQGSDDHDPGAKQFVVEGAQISHRWLCY